MRTPIASSLLIVGLLASCAVHRARVEPPTPCPATGPYVYVLGAVNQPKRVATSGPMPLREALSQAGGVAVSAKEIVVERICSAEVFRVWQGSVEVDLDGVELQPGDTVSLSAN